MEGENGMEILESGPLLLGVVFIGFFSITLFVRRWLASRRSGGPFFTPSILAMESSISMSLCVSVGE